MAMTKEQAIEKAKKLMSLGDSDNPNEAALAVARAQEILSRYEIQMADLDVPDDEEFQELEFDLRGEGKKGYGNMIKWKANIVNAVAKANGCNAFFQGAKCFFCGKESDVKTARELTKKLFIEVEGVARRASAGLGRRYANSFKVGVSIKIYEILERQAEEVKEAMRGTVSDSALVVVEDKERAATEWMESRHDIKSSNTRTTVNGEAFDRGMQAGEQAYNSAANERIAS